MLGYLARVTFLSTFIPNFNKYTFLTNSLLSNGLPFALVLFLVAPRGGGSLNPKLSTISIRASFRTWPAVHNTNGEDVNNDAFTLHSVPLALTAIVIMHRQRCLSPLSMWVNSSLCSRGRDIRRRGDNRRAPVVLGPRTLLNRYISYYRPIYGSESLSSCKVIHSCCTPVSLVHFSSYLISELSQNITKLILFLSS